MNTKLTTTDTMFSAENITDLEVTKSNDSVWIEISSTGSDGTGCGSVFGLTIDEARKLSEWLVKVMR